MISFLPILAFIGLIVAARFFLTRMSVWTPRRTWGFVGGYIGLGFVAFMSLPFIAGDAQQVLLREEIAEVKQQVDEANTHVANNDWELVNPAYKKETFTFTADGSNITVKQESPSDNTMIYVTLADRTTNDIEATYYELPIISSGINLTDELPPTAIEFEQNILTVKDEELELTYYTMKPTLMVVENFIEPFHYEDALHHYFIGNRILHLNVPKHMHIIDESGWIQYLFN